MLSEEGRNKLNELMLLGKVMLWNETSSFYVSWGKSDNGLALKSVKCHQTLDGAINFVHDQVTRVMNQGVQKVFFPQIAAPKPPEIVDAEFDEISF